MSAVSITARLPWERAEGKVQPWHRDRLAAVYVRQSTAAQVADHAESTRLQYGLAERAVTLGWAPSRVLVIDEDLGHSASGADARPGFARLVAEVGLDHVGIVLGIEMSRLARSGREWHQLLELCALSGALLGDLDGVYDPAEHNDRLLLGLKGTISEAELHLIRQRMWSGRVAKARRGELAVPLPAGLVRRPSGEVVLDPDEQVRSVVRLVFDLFDRLGTVGAVLGFLAGQPHPAGGAAARRTRVRGAGLAPPQPRRGGQHAAQPGLRWHLRLWPQHTRSQAAPAGAAVHRPGPGRPGPVAGLPARGAAGLYQHRAVRAEHAASGRQPVPRAEPGRGARRPGPAGRAGGLRPVRQEDDGPLPARPGREAAPGLRVQPRQVRLRRRPVPAAGRPLCRRARHRSAAGRDGTRRAGGFPGRGRRRSRPSANRWTGSGGSAWNAPITRQSGPGASTSSPSRRTAWSSGSWRRTGRPRWPSGSAWARSTTGSPPPAPGR